MNINELMLNKIREVLKFKSNNGDRDAGFIVAVFETRGEKPIRNPDDLERVNQILQRLEITFK